MHLPTMQLMTDRMATDQTERALQFEARCHRVRIDPVTISMFAS